MKINFNKQKLNDLINKFEQWKQEYSQQLQRYDIKIQHSRNKQTMLNAEQVSLSYDFCFVFFFCFNRKILDSKNLSYL